jgi:alanine racemase
MNRSWVEIDLDRLASNIGEVRKILSPSCQLMAVVKADAYGHGVKETARVMRECGVGRFAVATAYEGIELRNTGITEPILILGYTSPDMAVETVGYGLTHTVFDTECAIALSEAARGNGSITKIHIKIDTGMSRIGFLPEEGSLEKILKISELPGLEIEGIYTHFAKADSADPRDTLIPFGRFLDFCGSLENAGLAIPVKHAANSAAAIRFPETHLDFVRCGIALYGLDPAPGIDYERIPLEPVMVFKARVILVKEVPAGTQVSYGGIFTTTRPSQLATLSVGYADGYTRRLGMRSSVLLNGQRAPVVGNICMDQCVADVTDIEGPVKANDEAVLIGRQGGETITAGELAAATGTIDYEVVCAVSRRIPRVYFLDGKPGKISNYLLM